MAISKNPPQPWVQSPIVSSIGTIWLAGQLQDKSHIPADRMRVLGRYALILVLNGQCRYTDATGRDLNLRPGDAVFVGPDLPHAYGNENHDVWGQVFVVFNGSAFDLLQGSPTFQSHQPVWHLEPVELWKRRLEEILSPSQSLVPIEGLQTIGRFLQLLIEMATTDATARKRPEGSWVEESMKLLGEPHRNGWLRPQQVAKLVGQSYESFRKRFAEETGSSPARFQKKRRVDMACAAIYAGSDNFKELAESLGFCDVYHFSKVFRQFVGTPPSVYRRTVRGG
jgi:AraC-like DNA-binding protein